MDNITQKQQERNYITNMLNKVMRENNRVSNISKDPYASFAYFSESMPYVAGMYIAKQQPANDWGSINYAGRSVYDVFENDREAGIQLLRNIASKILLCKRTEGQVGGDGIAIVLKSGVNFNSTVNTYLFKDKDVDKTLEHHKELLNDMRSAVRDYAVDNWKETHSKNPDADEFNEWWKGFDKEILYQELYAMAEDFLLGYYDVEAELDTFEDCITALIAIAPTGHFWNEYKKFPSYVKGDGLYLSIDRYLDVNEG